MRTVFTMSCQEREAKVCKRIRLATMEDAVQLWRLANDPTVRENSFHPQQIDIESHLQWFREKLSSPTTRIWVLERGSIIEAQVRYDRVDGRVAEIGVAVLASLRGRGLATELLRATLGLACSELGVDTFRALVIIGNQASARLFRRLGFTYVGNDVRLGRKCAVFEYSPSPVPHH